MKHSEKHEELFGEWMRYLEEVCARIPQANPDNDPEYYKRAKRYPKRVAWRPLNGRLELDDGKQASQ